MDIPVWEKITITKEEAAALTGIGINKIDELLRTPGCPFVLYIGRKKLVKRKAFEQFLESNEEL